MADQERLLDPRRLLILAQEGIGKQDSSLAIHGYQRPRSHSTLASLAFGKDSLIFSWEGADRDIVCLVGLPPICYWMYAWLDGHRMDGQAGWERPEMVWVIIIVMGSVGKNSCDWNIF